MKRKIGITISIISVFISLIMVPTSFAADGDAPTLPTNINLPSGEANVKYFTQTFIPKIFGWFIASVGVFGLIFILIGGIQFLTSYGNEQGIETAKKTVMYAVVGTIIALLSYTIITIISNLHTFFPNTPPTP